MIVRPNWSKYRNEYFASVAATLSVFMVVTTNAWSSPALVKLQSEDSPFPVTLDEGSWVVAIQAIGAVLGPIVAGLSVDRIGRKVTLLGTIIPIIAGWVLVGVGDTVAYLYAARFMFGVSYGTAYSVSPIYLGEITSDTIRGSAGTLITVLAKMGYLAVYCVGPYVEYRTLAWLGMVGPALFVFCFIWMPESPIHLLAKNNDEAAQKSLSWLRRSSTVVDELATLKVSVQQSQKERGTIMELFSPVYRKNIGITVMLVFGMQMTGMLVILGYAQTIFEKISTDLTSAEMSIVLGVVQMVAAIFPAVLVDRMGRRPLMLISTFGTTLGLATCSIYFAVDEINGASELGWIAFTSLLVYIVSYNLGLSTVSFSIISEIFPKNIRAYATAAFVMLGAVIVFGLAKLFQVTLDEVGPWLPFAIFGCCGAIACVLIYLYIPETKGKSLDEIQVILAGKHSKHQY
ncbi:facilitated trehalose transporter Tret1-like [Sabethes cyaneus]|uniref:facilitated trehalose transporter Tret1-like n=1 Tax=Sabethes cyaneus TaxID=53552 RepID=UPI00237ED74B|nr:facilitated trehalose transporter Tret1-like [Sabethes cyaneus]